MTIDPDPTWPDAQRPATSVELRSRHDPIALVLDLLRTASLITMAIALIVIAAVLT